MLFLLRTDHEEIEDRYNYDHHYNARPLDYSWVLDIREQCINKNVSFEFRQCGTHFIKDGKAYTLNTRDLCSQARKANINYRSGADAAQG